MLVGIAVMLIGKVKRVPRRLIHLLWVIPFLRMWIPVSIAGQYSLMSLISKYATKTVVVYQGVETFSVSNFTQAAKSYFPISYKENVLEDIFCVASYIWLVVTVAILLVIFILYYITKKELKDASCYRDNIYLSDKITSPAVYGIIRPKIILPSSYVHKDLTFILAHENAHIKARDNLFRVLAFITAAIHWFNPFTWLFLKHFLEATELACDERVLKECGESQKKQYALELINCTLDKNVFASAFGGAKVRVRVESILSYRKLSVCSSICFTGLAVAIGYILLTNAK